MSRGYQLGSTSAARLKRWGNQRLWLEIPNGDPQVNENRCLAAAGQPTRGVARRWFQVLNTETSRAVVTDRQSKRLLGGRIGRVDLLTSGTRNGPPLSEQRERVADLVDR